MAEPGAGPDGSLNQDDVRRFRAHPDAELTPDQLEALVARLIEKREQLVVNLEGLRGQIVAKEDCSLSDAADAASMRAEAGRARGLAEQHEHTVAEIDAALERLRDGRYGVCERSGEPIPHGRLSLVPWAGLCRAITSIRYPDRRALQSENRPGQSRVTIASTRHTHLAT